MGEAHKSLFGIDRKYLQEAGGWDIKNQGVGWDAELFYRLFKTGAAFHVLSDWGLHVKHLTHRIDHVANYESFKRNAIYFISKYPRSLT